MVTIFIIIIITSIQLNKLKDEVGMAGSKSIQTRYVRDNCIYCTSLCLLFLIITHLLMSMYLSSEVCGRLIQALVVTMVGWSVWFNCIRYYWLFLHSSKSKRRDSVYSRCDYPLQILFVYFLILPSLLLPSINFYSYLFYSFLCALSAIYQCHLTWLAHNFCPVSVA